MSQGPTLIFIVSVYTKPAKKKENEKTSLGYFVLSEIFRQGGTFGF